jgi:hypothetical protein
VRNIIGDLSNTERVLVGLDLKVQGARKIKEKVQGSKSEG